MSVPNVVLLTIPGLRHSDLALTPNLRSLGESGSTQPLSHHFPAVTWPSQANMLTGVKANQHGVVANGFYWRDSDQVEMWTAWNKVIERPQIWDLLKTRNPKIKTAAWFPMLSKGCGADFVCMPAPIHQPDGSEDLWCYTKPQEFYGELLEKLGHFPLQHFWGPMANIKSTEWIVDSAIQAAVSFSPNFFYIYLPHLDYAAQKFGPDSDEAIQAIGELDKVIGVLKEQFSSVYDSPIQWLALSEYSIQPVSHFSCPNRVLREAGLLTTESDQDNKELIDRKKSTAWALVDHQFSHVFVGDPSKTKRVKEVLLSTEGIEFVLDTDEQKDFGLGHERSGDLIAVSNEGSWQAYYWWLDDALAPEFARTVDIHQKPGYDPVELYFDFATKSIPLDASLIKGSHGRARLTDGQHESINDSGQGVLISSSSISNDKLCDLDICNFVLQLFP